MLKSNLILLEGVPGSGKSSTGSYLQGFLENNGIHNHFWREGDFDNPADFEGIACLDAVGYRELLSRNPELAILLQRELTIRGDDCLLSYRKIQHLFPQKVSQPLIDELSRYDVYDGLPMTDYCRLALQRWQDFQKTIHNSDTVTLLECCFLQNPLTVLLARHDVDFEVARQQIMQMAGILKESNPLVIYLNSSPYSRILTCPDGQVRTRPAAGVRQPGKAYTPNEHRD